MEREFGLAPQRHPLQPKPCPRENRCDEAADAARSAQGEAHIHTTETEADRQPDGRRRTKASSVKTGPAQGRASLPGPPAAMAATRMYGGGSQLLSANTELDSAIEIVPVRVTGPRLTSGGSGAGVLEPIPRPPGSPGLRRAPEGPAGACAGRGPDSLRPPPPQEQLYFVAMRRADGLRNSPLAAQHICFSIDGTLVRGAPPTRQLPRSSWG